LFINWLKKIIASPSFENDDDRSFLATQINTIVITGLIAVFGYLILLFLFTSSLIAEQRILILLITAIILVFVKVLLHHGFIKQSALLLLIYHWLLFNLTALFSGGISSVIFSGNILVVIISALLLGFIPAIITATLSLLIGIIEKILVANHAVGLVFIITPESQILTQALFCFCAAGIFKVTVQNIYRTIKNVKVLNDRYKTLFTDSPNAIILTDELGIINLVNKSFTDIFEYKSEEIVGKELKMLLIMSDKKTFASEILSGSQSISKRELFLNKKDGSLANISLSMNRLPDNGYQYIISDITDIKGTENAYVESEAKWRFALDGSGFGVWDLDLRSGHVVYSNQWKSMIGFDVDEIGDTLNEWFGRVHPDDFEKCQKDFEKHTLNQSSFFQNEHRIKSKDGNYRWMLSRGKVMERSENGEALRVIGTHFDISTRKSAEETIQESEIRLRTIFNSSSDALLIIEDSIISDCNDITLSLYESSRENIIGKSIFEFLSTNEQDDKEINISDVVSAVLDGKKQHFEKKLKKKNGSIFDAELSLNRFEIKGYHYIHVIIRDITEKKKIREAIAASELQFRTIFNTSQYSIAINRISDGRYLSVNPAFETVSGYSEAEVIGKTSFELGLVKKPDDLSQIASELTKNKKSDNYKSIFFDKKGEMHYVLISSALILFENESCVLSTIVDITNIERAEQHFRQAQKMDVVGQLAGGVAHDFNNMLSGILGFAELLKLKLKDDLSANKYVDKIIETAARSSDLTRKLLAFARKGKTVSTPIDINAPIKEAISILERSIDKRIKINTKLSAEQTTIIGDPSLLQNAFLNLGINARDAMPNGGVLSFSSSIVFLDSTFCDENIPGADPGFFIEILVSDTGTGMDKHVMEKIFEPFFTTKEVGKGTGLGLAAVYGTIKEHKGSIKVYSELGVGTIFKIYIPVDKNIVLSKTDEEPELITGKGKILFVDDESIIRNVGFSQLTNLGYEVILAEDGQQAMDIFKTQYKEISIVILDMIMPRLNGKDTFLKMKEIQPDVKVIFSSGFSHDGRVNDLLKLGAIAFLQKPYRVYEISKILADALK
jgi:PAS domain S-box-containing protein